MGFAVMPFRQVASLKCHPHARATRCFAVFQFHRIKPVSELSADQIAPGGRFVPNEAASGVLVRRSLQRRHAAALLRRRYTPSIPPCSYLMSGTMASGGCPRRQREGGLQQRRWRVSGIAPP
jgi:hypothetical protein